jgi:hypothetical protein
MSGRGNGGKIKFGDLKLGDEFINPTTSTRYLKMSKTEAFQISKSGVSKRVYSEFYSDETCWTVEGKKNEEGK